MAGNPDLPFRAEYAKSGRASCRGCKSPIAKDSLRLAVMVQSPMFDGKVPHWYHYDCFFKRSRPKSVGDISHFEDLRWDDQEKIKKYIDNGGTNTSQKGKKRSATTDNLHDFRVEYAKSGGSTCKVCEIKIPKNEVRISKKDYDSERARMYGPMERWHHVDCFLTVREELEYFDAGDKIPGYKLLRDENQVELKAKITKIEKRKATSDVKEEPPAKKPKEDPDAKLMKSQNKKMFELRDKLKNLAKKELQSLLEHNEQDIPSGEPRMMDRLADVMTFGALKPCSECKNGQFVYRSGIGYQCTGHMSEWSKCPNTTQAPQRKEFNIPEELKEEYSFLKKYKCTIGNRIIPNNPPPSQPTTPKPDPVKKNGPPLKNLKFAIVGKFEGGTSAIKAKIESMGGRVTRDINKKLAAVISNKDEIVKMSKKIKEAQDADIQVISVDFLEDVKAGNVADLIVERNLSSWGSNPQQRITVDEVDLSRSKSIYTMSMPTKMKMKLKGGAAVDPDSGLDDVAHVLQIKKDVYNSVLNLADIQSGKNSYYKIQILENDNKSQWWVFRSWGRVGTTIGDNKLEDMADRDDAIEQFETLYLQRTGSPWSNRKNFVKQPGMYCPLDIDYGQDNETVKVAATIKPDVDSKLHKAVQDLVCMILDVEKMQKAMVEFELDLKKMPLGKLSKRQIESAYKVLGDLQEQLKNGGSAAKFLDGSNRFYTLIPHDYGIQNPPILDNEELIKQKIAMLDNLMEIEVAYNILTSAGDDGKNDTSVDGQYKKLKSDIDVLNKDSDEFKMLEKYVKNTHASTHSTYSLKIDEVFKVVRKNEARRYKPFKKLSNRMLLWHGSRVTNVAGILSQGLRIAPPEAPVTGYMFGKGIYFADMVSKSANYCNATKSNPTGLLLLCEVALGNMYERTQAEFVEKLPPGTHSTKGVGQTAPNPKDALTLDDGVVVPLGKGAATKVKNSALLYNEYIVYDIAQVNVKYLLKVDFKFKY